MALVLNVQKDFKLFSNQKHKNMNNYQNGIGFNGSWPAPVPNEFASIIQKIAPKKEEPVEEMVREPHNTFVCTENNDN